ncbi:phosphoesterase [Halogeometricum borinquense DSM 11551]|uniref:Phosphoesterase n=1 Tax=Halogeometricum borinquense (strain ATCC 700274 / DSM 11551 / JCM 10706 / KCTC 4070 / PR3) TaxID=469382 RepID=E4NNC8_HALBP|nr:metallophosphoesterase [Halogeometricum borinquense]ADQ67466.1 putative phosphoesterase [Halogeometricum borinquense DSM 11551]ELY23852.1 phosphoesterase [Halogeometricum borinquense DSM 11551]
MARRGDGPIVEPVPGDPAAVAHLGPNAGDETALVVADYHAGIEAGLRYERGVELDSDADVRLARLLRLLDETNPDRLVVLGDLGHRIGAPKGDEADELETFVERTVARVPITLVRGNHDGGIAEAFGDRIDVTDGSGIRLGRVGFVHGHTWPSCEVVESEVVCAAHEHPAVRLADSVGGSRKERAWLRGPMNPDPFAEALGLDVVELAWQSPELVVFPAFNDRSGGTWVNVEGQEFLSPFLPDGVFDADAYLLDGTRLGPYRSV